MQTFPAAHTLAPADAGRHPCLGSSRPVTPPGACVGRAATAALLRCLQPDRRVEISVTAAR